MFGVDIGVVSLVFTCFPLVADVRFVSVDFGVTDPAPVSGVVCGALPADFLVGVVFFLGADLGVSAFLVLILFYIGN